MENEELEVNIVNEESFSSEEIVTYSRKSIIRQTISFIVIGIIIFLAGVSMLILKLANAFDGEWLTWILLVCGALIIGLPFLLTLFLPKVLQRQNKALYQGFKYRYRFTDTTFTVSIESEDSKSVNKHPYKHLYRVNVIDDAVFIYINSSVLYMLKLSGFKSEEEKNKAMDLLINRKKATK